MNPTEGNSDWTAAGRLHSSIGLTMLGVVAGTCLVLVGMANNEALGNWMRRVSWEQSRWKKQLPFYAYNHHFVDSEEWLLHEEIPAIDYSRGGVYFLGASSMKWATTTWDLPDELRPLIHNFSMGGTKHSDQFDFIRFLVEEEGLLEAGPQKTLMVFGTNYRIVHHGRLPGKGPGEVFRLLWTRHGFYTMDPDGTIHHTGLNVLAKRLILERTKLTGLLKELVNLVYAPFKSTRVHNWRYYDQEWTEALGPHWKEYIEAELAAFERTLDYLQRQRVKSVVVLFPMGRWGADLPYQPAYVKKLRKICDSAGVKVYDFSRLLDDEDFADSDHLNPTGIEKFQDVLMGICLDHLKSAGILPARDTSNSP